VKTSELMDDNMVPFFSKASSHADALCFSGLTPHHY